MIEPINISNEINQHEYQGYVADKYRYLFIIHNNPEIPKHAQELLADVLDKIIHNTIEKFERGQMEHGGSLLERDLIKDIHDEAIDQLVYATCEQIKREMKK